MAMATLQKVHPRIARVVRRPRLIGKSNNNFKMNGWKFDEFEKAFGRELKKQNQVWFESFFQQKIGRRAQIAVKVIAIIGTIFTIMNMTLEYEESPTVTTMESDSYPARDVDFPGIAVCSTNKMSLQAVNELAEDIHSLETTKIFNVSFEEIRSMLKYLGHLYVFDVAEDEIEDVLFLHAILSRAYGDYNIDQFMMQLTPKCKSILKHCSWEGKDRVCDNMFFLRKTQDGFCCTFNYARRNDGFGSSKRSGFVSSMVEKSTVINPVYGLSVILDPRIDDNFYKTDPNDGFKILIFSSLDYPDASSGSLREFFVPRKSEVFLSMDAISFHSISDVLDYKVDQRNCLFNTEQDKIFQGYYSYSDCLMHCRLHDILRLCKCLPFFYPRLLDTDSPRSCNLDDLSCLKEYILKWRQVRPRFSKKSHFHDDDISGNPSGYLKCDCFPSCDDVVYKISSSEIPLTTNKILWDRHMIINRNYSLLHVYFDGPNTIRLKQDVLYYWYELMSDLGGICSLFLGISIINVLEIIYVMLNLILRRERRGIIIDRNVPDDNVIKPMKNLKLQDYNTEKIFLVNNTKFTKVVKPVVEQVVSIEVKSEDEHVQLYWQEFMKPKNDVSLPDKLIKNSSLTKESSDNE